MELLREISSYVNWEQVLANMDGTQTPKKAKRIQQFFLRLQEAPATGKLEMARLLYGRTRTASHPPFLALLDELNLATLKAYLTPNGRYTSSPSRKDMIQRCERTNALLFMSAERSKEARTKFLHLLVKHAAQCHHVSLELECLQLLQAIYGYRAYDEVKLLETEAEIRRCITVNRITARCKMAALDQRMASAEGLPYPAGIPLAEIEEAVSVHKFYDIQYAGGEVLTQIAIDQQDWPGALLHSGRALSFFREYFPKEKQPFIHFLYAQVMIYAAMEDFTKGWACWKKLYQFFSKEKSRSQVGKVIEMGTILLLRCGETKTTTELMQCIADAGGVTTIGKGERGRWLTYLRTLAFLNSGQPAVLELIAQQERKLRRGGKNISLLAGDELNLGIIECLDLLKSKSYRKAAGVVAGLKNKLPGRLSSSAPEYRLHLFLKLLVESAAANFHRAATIRKTTKTLKRLKATKPGIDDNGIDIELITFELLWEIMIPTLSEKAPRRPYLSA
ncbi:hypothetical protein FUA23_14370 [Neolewinella aurantiaca]|uniref:Uncharacterized protein n=1 Tax=Neolewinella aurantiaca TaxID=2602767 RepID=A0A5C7FCR6_9BACT|nr:hypothetical protein [Neolewinella aurantiaca]TXF88467.1 hypothetical protein FUA23_14370 [Neolewinella aurantiaca]